MVTNKTVTSVDKTPETAKSNSAGRSAKLSTDPLGPLAAVLTGSPVNRGLVKKVLFEEIEGCRIAYEVALADMTKILKGVPKNALMDIELATRYGAMMVIGTPENLEALRKIAPKISLGEPWRSKIGEGAAKWVETARVGLSSSFMLYTFTGFNALAWLNREDFTHGPKAPDHPYDGDDMTRCRRLLDAAPEYVDMMPKLAKKSANWKALVENWTQICDLMDQEAPQWRTVPGGRSPQTNKLMRQLTEQTQAQSRLRKPGV